MQKYNVGVFGATGMVGRTILRVLDERNFPLESLHVFASERSKGKVITFRDSNLTVKAIDDVDFDALDFALFATDPEVSARYIKRAAAAGVVCIDNSSAFRKTDGVDIIVPEVNGHLLKKDTKIIANPNCSTAQLTVVLNILNKKFGLKRVTLSTYQAVSGSGVPGVEQLQAERKGKTATNPAYPHAIFDNCLPAIGSFDETGYCTEEQKIIFELRKILNTPDLIVAPTTVRVPVQNCHSESVLAEFDKEISAATARAVLAAHDDVVLVDNPQENSYPLAVDARFKDEVYVGRLRDVSGWPGALQLWVVADNLRKGAATNVVQIAEKMIALRQ